MKDKNGRKICEGDIVLRYDFPDEPQTVTIRDCKLCIFEFEGKSGKK